MREVEIQEFLDASGRSQFAHWFGGLNAVAGTRDRCSDKAEPGKSSNVESVGAGVHELKIHFGPGYRVYFGKHGERVVILLGGSAKKRQRAAIAAAQAAWTEYRRRMGDKE